MLPVILLAFANDKQNSGAGYLRGLTLERNGIRDALLKAEENGLCQVVVEPDVTVDRLFDIFQSSTYRDRIAIFHYGGHAESYSLLLESASGGKAQAHSEGLVSFLSKQKSLKLVFLNGCSSQKQSEELVAAGLPAVIGTSQSINDTIATGLSNRFYKGLSAGVTIEKAWQDAIDQIKTETGTQNTKALYWEGILGAPKEDQFPWELYIGEGGLLSKAWNLPEAANQPLFGLELPKTYYRKLPQSPYVGLRSFDPDEAAIFFGRGADIRKIYTQLSQEQPVILLSGKKGVGKSSILAAGLVPRLESKYAASFCSVENKSLNDSFSGALEQIRMDNEMDPVALHDISDLEEKISALRQSISSSKGFAKEILERELAHLTKLSNLERLTYYDQWMAIEEKTGMPLVVSLDEVPHDPDVYKTLVEILVHIFETNPAPKGKLILSIDEENRAGFGEVLHSENFPFAEIFLHPMSWEALHESILGITKSPATKEFYKLQMEENASSSFPDVLARDLTDGDTTLVAPYLQVIMSAMWKSALHENPQAPSFTLRQYQQGIMSGKFMNRFLTEQLGALEEWNAGPVLSGLALDMLHLHTSALGKSQFLDASVRHSTYRDRQVEVDELAANCKKLFLLSGHLQTGTQLGHNLLALVVIRQNSISLRPGQQAARILNAKVGETDEARKKVWLNEADLEIVEKGMEGMRSLNEKEEALLAFSREKKLQAQRDRRRNRIIRYTLISIVALFAIIAAWQWQEASLRYLYSRAGELAFAAKEISKTDNTIALNIARQAYSVLGPKSPPEVKQTLNEIFHMQEERPFYAAKFQHRKIVNTAVFSSDGSQVLTASEDGYAILWDRYGNKIIALPHGPEVFMARFSPTGDKILTSTFTHVFLWEKDGTRKDSFPFVGSMISLDSFSTDGIKIIPHYYNDANGMYGASVDSLRSELNSVIPSKTENRILVLQDGYCSLYDEHGLVIKDSLVHNVFQASFSPDGTKFLTSERDGDNSHIRIWNESGDSLFSFSCSGDRVRGVFSPDGHAILTASSDFTARIWDFSNPFLHRFPKLTQAVSTVDYFPKEQLYVTASFDSTARIWNASGKMIDSLKHREVVQSASFSPDGKWILTTSRDSMARLWNPISGLVVELPHGASEITRASFSSNGEFVLTSCQDSFARVWNSIGTMKQSFHHNGDVLWAGFSPDDTQILTICSDTSATLWDAEGDSLHVFRHPDLVTAASFSADGENLLTSCRDSIVRQWSLDGKILLRLRHYEKLSPKISHTIFTTDGKYILTGGRRIKIWTSEGKLVDSLVHTENVYSVTLSPEGHQILTTCVDSNAYLWNLEGDLLATYHDHQAKLNVGVFTPDGNHILTAADDGYVLRWKTPQAIFSNLESAQIAQLSENEKKRYSVNRLPTLQTIFTSLKTAVIRLFSDKKE